MTSLFGFFRQHPIKYGSIFATANIALFFTYDYTLTRDLMETSCRKAAAYGDAKLSNPNAPVRHITVILNPVAGKRKSKKLYEKWVEPLFHLAGIKVSLIETQSPKQAYDLMKIMSNCDGVAIVGGDGTVHEALNGLLSRPDCKKAANDFPIGIIPTGQYNSIARYVHQGYVSYRNQKEFLIHSALRMVTSSTTKYDVLKIDPLDEELKQKTQPIYALRDVRYGIYQDNFFKISGYYYYEKLVKPLLNRLRRTTSKSKYPNPEIESITYTEPCIGCSKCSERHRLPDYVPEAEIQPTSANKRWWSMLAPVKTPSSGPTEEEERQLKMATRENENCGKWIQVGDTSSISDFRACMMGDRKVRLSLGREREYNPSDVTETQDVRLRLKPELDDEMITTLAQQQKANVKSAEPKDEVDTKAEDEKKPPQFLIDGQPTQAHSIDITAIEKIVTVYTGPYTNF